MALRKLKEAYGKMEGGQLRMQLSEWEDPELLGRIFFECIENLETMGMYATMEDVPDSTTCMDYLLDRMATYNASSRKPIRIRFTPNSYYGNNMELRLRMQDLHNLPYTEVSHGGLSENEAKTLWASQHEPGEEYLDFLYKRFGVEMPFSIAVSEFYVSNPSASPESEHCSIYYEDYGDNNKIKKTPVNCLTKIITMDKALIARDTGENSISYYGTDPYVNIINSGARCGKFIISVNDKNGKPIHKYTKTSCLEAVMDSDIKRHYDAGYRRVLDHSFGYNINKYNVGIDCIDTVSEIDPVTGDTGTIPCIQKLVQSDQPMYKHYIELIYNGRDIVFDRFVETLEKKYAFKPLSTLDVPESSAIDYMVNNGLNLWVLLQIDPGIDAFMNAECRVPDGSSPNGRRVNCLSKLLSNLMEDNMYYTDDMDLRYIILQSLSNSSLKRRILETECEENGEPVPCLSRAIDLAAKHRGMIPLISEIATESPLTDFVCSEKRGSGYKSVNCLDKMIGVSSQDLMDIVLQSGLLIDRKDCTDFDGTPITCIDKLFQRHQVWVHSYYRARELAGLSYTNTSGDYSRIKQTSEELSRLCSDNNLNRDPGFTKISGDYDIGSLKSHQPSKAFEWFKPILDAQLEDYRNAENLRLPPTRDEIRYIQELSRSITSDRLSRESQIAPKIYKMVDVYSRYIKGFEDYSHVGAGTILDSTRSSPVTLNMFECKDVSTDKTISCLQKQIDIVEVASKQYNIHLRADNVMALKDIFKPDMCVDVKTGDKSTCMEYAYNKIGHRMSDMSYIALVSRKDFSKVADTEINTPNGKEKLVDVVCRNVNIRDVSDYLASVKASHSVTNGHPVFDGSAMAIVSKCKCSGKATPLERRICSDKLCFQEYLQDDATAWGGGYVGNGVLTDEGIKNAMYPQIFHDSRDYYGVAGVYDITYKPSGYRITDTERFDYGEAVREILYPAIKRTKGMKIARFGDKKNVKIEEIDLESPSTPGGDYIINVGFSDDTGSRWSANYPAAQIFIRGGLLNSEDIRNRVIRYKNENDTVEKILTRGVGQSETEAKLKLVVSNRPVDFMRASTCQDWRSCMNVEDGCYNALLPYVAGMGGYMAYLASDEFSSSWYARTMLLPVMFRKEGDPNKNLNKDSDNWDPNNNIRINDVYGLSMYKPLLKDAIRIILRDHGYNAEGSYKSYADSDEFIMNSTHVKRVKEDVWMNCRKEAYRNCLERVIGGENVKLPNGNVADSDEDCKRLLLTMNHGGIRIGDIFQSGLLSKITYERYGITSEWETDYLDRPVTRDTISNTELTELKKKVSTEYVKPLTIPEDLPHGTLKGDA